MVKISKNAKKILALTLAGVMTVGTVVPGSALSTVENVQAAASESTKDAIKTVAQDSNLWLSISQKIQSEKNYYQIGSSDKSVTAIAETLVQNYVNEKYGENKYIVDLKSDDDNVIAKTEIVTIKLVVKDVPGDEATETAQFTLGNYAVSSSDVLTSWVNSDEVKKVLNTTVEVTKNQEEAIIKNTVEEVISETNLKSYVKAMYGITNGFNADTQLVSVGTIDPDKKTADVTVSIVSEVATEDKASVTVKVPFTYAKTTADKAADALNGFNEVKSTSEHSYTEDDLKTGEADPDLNTAVSGAAKEYLVAQDKTTFNNVTISIDDRTIAHYDADTSKWSGTLKISEDGNTVYKEMTVNVAKPDKKEETVEVIGKIADVYNNNGSGIVSVDKLDFSGVTLKVYNEGSSLPIATIKGTTNGKFDSKFETYFTIDRSAYQQKLGTYAIKITHKKTGEVFELPVSVKAKKTLDSVSDLGLDEAHKNVASVTVDQEGLTAKVNATNKTKVDFEATKAGTYSVTTKSTAGTIATSTVTVKEDGTITAKVNAAIGSVVLDNTDDVLGFVVRPIKDKTIITSENEKVAKAELTTVNGKSVLKITAGYVGETTITLTGGNNGNLETTFKVTVSEDGTLKLSEFKYTANKDAASIEITAKLEEKLQAHTYKDGDDVIAVAGLTEDDKVKVTTSNRTVDYVPVTDANISVKDNKVTIKYGYKEVSDTYTVKQTGRHEVKNDVSTLGLVGTSVKVENPADPEAVLYTNASIENGKVVIKVTKAPSNNVNEKVIITDQYGNTASVTYTVGKDGSISKATPVRCETVVTFKAPTKVSYKVGEKVDLSGATVTFTVNGETKTVPMTVDMLTINGTDAFTTNKVTIKDKDNVKFSYGKEDQETAIEVTPVEAAYRNTDLGLGSDEKFVGTPSYVGSDAITAKFADADRVVEIYASEINQKTSVIVSTNKGNQVTLNVSVDANGNITTDYFAYGKTITVRNNTETLGLQAKTLAIVGDSVKAAITGSNIEITGVKPGDAKIQAVDAKGNIATIFVTVDAKGNVVVTNIDKYKDYTPGWSTDANGNWIWIEEDGSVKEQGWINDGKNDYYIEGGVAVVSNWKLIGDTYYYFNKWGACIKNGWATINGGFYFFDEDGKMAESQWIKTGNYYYYVNKWGAAYTNGWYKIDGNYYCFNKWGAMYTNTYIGKYYVNKWGAWDSRYDKK